MSHTPSTPPTVAPALDSAPLLDAERLHVYAVALEFQSLASAIALRTDAVVRDRPITHHHGNVISVHFKAPNTTRQIVTLYNGAQMRTCNRRSSPVFRQTPSAGQDNAGEIPSTSGT